MKDFMAVACSGCPNAQSCKLLLLTPRLRKPSCLTWHTLPFWETYRLSEKTKHFIVELKKLMDSGKVSSDEEIINELEWNKTAFRGVKSRIKNIPPYYYRRFTEVYKVANIDNKINPIEAIRTLIDANRTLIDAILILAKTNSRLIELLVKLEEKKKIQAPPNPLIVWRGFLKTQLKDFLSTHQQ